MKIYYPYVSDKPDKKYYIITKTGSKVYFGASGYEDYTIHKNDIRKKAYISRHKKNEDWTQSGIDTAGYWSFKYLWSYPTKKEAYENIRKDLIKWGVI